MCLYGAASPEVLDGTGSLQCLPYTQGTNPSCAQLPIPNPHPRGPLAPNQTRKPNPVCMPCSALPFAPAPAIGLSRHVLAVLGSPRPHVQSPSRS